MLFHPTLNVVKNAQDTRRDLGLQQTIGGAFLQSKVGHLFFESTRRISESPAAEGPVAKRTPPIVQVQVHRSGIESESPGMTRRLPWATDANTGGAMKQRQTPVRQARHGQPVSSDDRPQSAAKPHQTSSPVKSPPKEQVRKRKTSRTPSSSPPPGPPPAELMHEGYHADDIFMLVEDEFQTVAQSFTRHLHHAEYVRMKKKARATPFAATVKLDNGMPTETRKHLEAQNMHHRQDVAVKSMISGKSGRSSPADDGEDEAPGKDPWQGTSLAGLMTKDITHKRTALVGLEQIPSTTRAARGFHRGEGESPRKREEQRSILEIYSGRTNKRRTTSPTPGAPTGDSDDDLNAPPTTKQNPKHARPQSAELRRPLPPDPQPEHAPKPKLTTTSTTSHPGPKPPSSTSLLRKPTYTFDDDFHSSDDVQTLSTKNFSRNKTLLRTRDGKPATKEKEKGMGKEMDRKKGKVRLDDIPTFLI